MKNKRHYINKAGAEPAGNFVDSSSDEMMEDVIGTKVLYNWLYQQEEENYYTNLKVPDFFPDNSEHEALFVEY
jgi:hypothetical protein